MEHSSSAGVAIVPSLPLDRTKFWIDVGSKEAVQDMPSDAYLNSVRSLVGDLQGGWTCRWFGLPIRRPGRGGTQ